VRVVVCLSRKISLIVLATSTFGVPLFAQEAPASKDTTVSIGTSYFTQKYDKSGSQFELSGWVTTLGLDHRLGEQWSVGASLSGTRVESRTELNSNQRELRGVTPSVNVGWTNLEGLYVSGSAAYGKTAMDNTRLLSGRSRFYQSNTEQLSTTLGATQYIPITRELLSSVGLRYSRFFNTEREYIDPAGGNTPSRKENWGMASIDVGLSYTLGDFTPFASGNFNRTNKEIIDGGGNRNYVGYRFGTSYKVSESTNLNLSYAGKAGIANLTDRAYSLSLGYGF
jgi:long-subunit fatty acid transport protein